LIGFVVQLAAGGHVEFLRQKVGDLLISGSRAARRPEAATTVTAGIF
jgi:hypothetical protein